MERNHKRYIKIFDDFTSLIIISIEEKKVFILEHMEKHLKDIG